MTYEEDRIDLLRHEKEIVAHQSFNYALLDKEETTILGCVYIDPPERVGSDGEISWWVVDDLVGGEMECALEISLVRAWPCRWLPVWKDQGDGANPFRVPASVGRRHTGQ